MSDISDKHQASSAKIDAKPYAFQPKPPIKRSAIVAILSSIATSVLLIAYLIFDEYFTGELKTWDEFKKQFYMLLVVGIAVGIFLAWIDYRKYKNDLAKEKVKR